MDEKTLSEILLNLLDYLTVLSVNTEVLKRVLKSNHKEFEDAVQIICASSVENIDFLITRNIKIYKNIEIPVLSPEEFFIG